MANYSGLHNGVYGTNHSLISTSRGQGYNALSRMFARRTYGRKALGELISTLVAGAVGDAALATHLRVKARRELNGNVNGGVAEIETFEDIDRVTVQADADRIVAALNASNQPTYAVDKSGSAGGGKLGY